MNEMDEMSLITATCFKSRKRQSYLGTRVSQCDKTKKALSVAPPNDDSDEDRT
jgi:hypothetical protein